MRRFVPHSASCISLLEYDPPFEHLTLPTLTAGTPRKTRTTLEGVTRQLQATTLEPGPGNLRPEEALNTDDEDEDRFLTTPEIRKMNPSKKARYYMEQPKIKIAMPSSYDGMKRGREVDEFINGCELYFIMKKRDFKDDSNKIGFTIGLLEGLAKS